jgi:hypothetical protein
MIPAGLTECEREGIAGNCGPSCTAFKGGQCETNDEIVQLMISDFLSQMQDPYTMEQAIEILQEEIEDEELIDLLKQELSKQTKRDVEEAWNRAKGVL